MQLQLQPGVNERSGTSDRGKLASIYAGGVLPPQLQAEEAPNDGFNSASFARRQWIITLKRTPTVRLQARSRNIDHSQSTAYPEPQQNIGQSSNYHTVFHILSQGHRRAHFLSLKRKLMRRDGTRCCLSCCVSVRTKNKAFRWNLPKGSRGSEKRQQLGSALPNG